MTLRRSLCPSVLWLIASVLPLVSHISGASHGACAGNVSSMMLAQGAGPAKPGADSWGDISGEAIVRPCRSASVGAEVGGTMRPSDSTRVIS